jgi:hypothetical protein
VQNEPNLQKRQNQRNSFSHKELWQTARLPITKSKPKTNPNEPKANPIFGPSGPPKAKANPNKPNFSMADKNEPNFHCHKGL